MSFVRIVSKSPSMRLRAWLFAGVCAVGRTFGAGRAGSVDAGKRGCFGVNPTEHRVCLFAGGA